MSNRTRHSIFKKTAVVSEVLLGDKSQAEIAREYAIAPSLVSQWKRQMLENGRGYTRKHPLPDPALPQRKRRRPRKLV